MVNRKGRRKPGDRIDIGSGNLVQKLSGVSRETVNVLSLAFGIERVERKRTLATARHAGDYGDCVAGDIEIDVTEIVHARPTNLNRSVCGILARRLLGVTMTRRLRGWQKANPIDGEREIWGGQLRTPVILRYRVSGAVLN